MKEEGVSLGTVIAAVREERGWTLRQLGDAMAAHRKGRGRAGRAVSPQFINDVERGRRDVPDDMLEVFAAALGLDPNHLRLLAGKPTPEMADVFRAAGAAAVGGLIGRAALRGLAGGAMGGAVGAAAMLALPKVFELARRKGFIGWDEVADLIEKSDTDRAKGSLRKRSP